VNCEVCRLSFAFVIFGLCCIRCTVSVKAHLKRIGEIRCTCLLSLVLIIWNKPLNFILCAKLIPFDIVL
jgi:hypothetical protein